LLFLIILIVKYFINIFIVIFNFIFPPRGFKWYIYWYNKETTKWKVKKAKKEWDKIILELFPKYIEYNHKNNTLSIFPKHWISSYILYLNKIKTWKIVIKKI